MPWGLLSYFIGLAAEFMCVLIRAYGRPQMNFFGQPPNIYTFYVPYSFVFHHFATERYKEANFIV